MKLEEKLKLLEKERRRLVEQRMMLAELDHPFAVLPPLPRAERAGRGRSLRRLA